jgi:predicted phosphate transport protein (TIGR00153 family)
MTLSTVFSMFAKSPIRPIQEHMATALACARELLPFIEDLTRDDWDAAVVHEQLISRLCQEADNLKRELRLQLPKGLFLPVPRSDLLRLLYIQGELPKIAKRIATLMLGRKMTIPPAIVEPFGKYLHSAIEASIQANKAINELDELLETGFSGSEVVLVEDMIVKLDKIDAETNRLQTDIRARLFALESELNPVDVVFLYKVIEWVGRLADQAQLVGDQLQILLTH